MGCSDSSGAIYPYSSDTQSDTSYKLHLRTKWLCEVLTLLEADYPKAFQRVSPEMAEWWKEHKAFDVERLKREAAVRDKEKLKSKALSKLTKEEKAALELPDGL